MILFMTGLILILVSIEMFLTMLFYPETKEILRIFTASYLFIAGIIIIMAGVIRDKLCELCNIIKKFGK